MIKKNITNVYPWTATAGPLECLTTCLRFVHHLYMYCDVRIADNVITQLTMIETFVV
jgi:hypothetical protein